MSVLDLIRERPGAYRWDGDVDRALWVEAVESDDVRLVALHGSRAVTKPAVLDGLAEALRFPDYFGRNLDALADCLADLDTFTVLLWQDWAAFAAAEPDDFAAVLAVLAERAAQPGFALLLHGAGPAVDLPALDG